MEKLYVNFDNYYYIFLGLLSTIVDMWTFNLWTLWISLCITYIFSFLDCGKLKFLPTLANSCIKYQTKLDNWKNTKKITNTKIKTPKFNSGFCDQLSMILIAITAIDWSVISRNKGYLCFSTTICTHGRM